MPLFYQTPSEAEIDAVMRSEREEERRKLQEADNWERYIAQNPRRYCTNIQHILGGDCPDCDVLTDELFIRVIDACGRTVYVSDLYH